MVLLVLVAIVLLIRYGLRHGWPGAVAVKAWWASHHEMVGAFVRRSPATFAYLAILTVTTWVLVGASADVVDAMLHDQSTNLSHLGHDPIRVLVRSAFWLSSYELLFWAVLYLAVLAPAERWLGTGRWLIAFAAGHVGATLLTATGVWLAIRSGIASHRLEDAVDVGVSYGFAAVAALFTYRLPGRWRWLWAAGLLSYVGAGILLDGSFTSFGHATAVLIGFALYPLTRSSAVQNRRAEPILLPMPRQPTQPMGSECVEHASRYTPMGIDNGSEQP
jgi:hypothetical protein